MNTDPVRRVADAVLYEGYILYPYRASAQKNRSRWQFGVLMPPGYAAADDSERDVMQAECVLEHSGQPGVQVIARFLQVQRRTSRSGGMSGPAGSWDEAVEREVEVALPGAEVLGRGRVREFAIPGGEQADGPVTRRRERLDGTVSVHASPVPGPWQAVRLRVRLENRTAAQAATRDQALPSALVAAHLILSVTGGKFVSMTDPPAWAAATVAECENTGCWPVLADPDRGRQVVLAAPIILYDYPELAPESPGELYDGTEIDEILTLRTLALSDAEKREARATDPRAAALIDRVESLDAHAMRRLHGTIRTGDGPVPPGEGAGRRAEDDPGVPWWDPDADAAVSPETDSVSIGGQQIARGAMVRLRPGARRADAQDMFLAGRIAEVQAVLYDVEDRPYLAVSLADAPDADLRIAHGRFLYFGTDEVEPVQR